jgi:hypothetical protein
VKEGHKRGEATKWNGPNWAMKNEDYMKRRRRRS